MQRFGQIKDLGKPDNRLPRKVRRQEKLRDLVWEDVLQDLQKTGLASYDYDSRY